MDPILMAVIGVVVGGGLGAFGLSQYLKLQAKKKKHAAQAEAERILKNAKVEAQKVEQRARENETKLRKSVENDIHKQKQSLQKAEQSYKDKEEQIEKRFKDRERVLEAKTKDLEDQRQKLSIVENRTKEVEGRLHEKVEALKGKLESAAQLSASQAKDELVQAVKREAEVDAAKQVTVIESEAKAEAEKRAKRIISMAIARYAGEYAAERTVSIIPLPNEDIKGKIIGREGRNIRALEAACGVDLIVDETPEAVIISAFDPVRREVARRALEQLMEDGRIHPSRIEEVIHKVKSSLFQSIKEDGEKAFFELGLPSADPEIVKLIGSLKYRTSFTQNNYSHSIEVGFLAGMMASELGVDVKAARRAGLLHDLGKALDHSIEGSHAIIGADFAKKHGESEIVCHAIRSHHEDEQPKTIIAHLVQAADALSSARPGARSQMMESYVKRLEDLESIGNSFDGVERTFAIQAGREVRVLVEGGKVNDEQALMLSRDIARKIEREMKYPGQVKVTVIRETRAVDYAR